MKTSLIIFLNSLIITFSYSQELNCNEKLKTVPYFVLHPNSPKDSISIDFDVLRTCGNLDVVDQLIFLGPLLSDVMIKLSKDEDKIIYQDLIDHIISIKEKEAYKNMRIKGEAAYSLINTAVNINELDSQSVHLKALGVPEDLISGFYIFLIKNQDKKWNYMDAFNEYNQ